MIIGTNMEPVVNSSKENTEKLVKSIEKLSSNIEKLNESTERYSHGMLFLTIALFILAFFQLLVMLFYNDLPDKFRSAIGVLIFVLCAYFIISIIKEGMKK